MRWVQRLEAHGTAPVDVIPRVAQRLLQRVGQAEAALTVEIGGAPERWDEFLARFANGHASANGNGYDRVDRA